MLGLRGKSKRRIRTSINTIKYVDPTPSLGQSKRIRKLSEEKKGIQNKTISFNKSKIEKACQMN